MPKGVTRWVAVSVATVWRGPDRPRPIDLPALAAPVGLRDWLAAMDVEAKKGLVGRIETQALLGQPVTVLEERDGWARVAVPEQAEPGAPGGYPGWVPSWQLTDDPAWAAVAPQVRRAGTLPGATAPRAGTTVTVSALTTWLYHRPHPQARWLEVSFGTCLPVVAGLSPGREEDGKSQVDSQAGDGWLAVAVPAPRLGPPPSAGAARSGRLGHGGRPGRDPMILAGAFDGNPAELAAELGLTVAWIRPAAVRVDDPGAGPGAAAAGRHGPEPAPAGDAGGASPAEVTGASLLETARQFLGLPYLWGGTSGFGVDCSGFMYLVHRFHGILIPRDAAPQRDHGHGVPVERDQLQSGDLVFFAHDGGKGDVHHVGMYAGEGRMIHAPSSERVVEEIPLDTPPYGEKFAGARRYH